MPRASSAGVLDGSITEAKMAASAVSTSKLKSSTQAQIIAIGSGVTYTFILTGGEYCFRPTIKANAAASNIDFGLTTSATTGFRTLFPIKNNTSNKSFYCTQRYITSSGEIIWLFIMRELIGRNIVGMSIAPDHPCFNSENYLETEHPFSNYDPLIHEIICINPSLEQYDEIDNRCIIDGQPDKDMLDTIIDDYDIIESDNLEYPIIPISIGLPKRIEIDGKNTIVDYRFLETGTVIEPIKKVIKKPSYITVKRLRLKP